MAMELCQLLQRHTEMEEAILYPELEQVDSELFEDAKEEHEETEDLPRMEEVCGEPRMDQLGAEMQRWKEDPVNASRR